MQAGEDLAASIDSARHYVSAAMPPTDRRCPLHAGARLAGARHADRADATAVGGRRLADERRGESDAAAANLAVAAGNELRYDLASCSSNSSGRSCCGRSRWKSSRTFSGHVKAGRSKVKQ